MVTVLLGIAGCFLLLIALLLFSPLQAHLSLVYREYRFSGTGSISFFTPRLISVRFDMVTRKASVYVLGRSFKRKRREAVTQPVSAPVDVRQDAPPEQSMVKTDKEKSDAASVDDRPSAPLLSEGEGLLGKPADGGDRPAEQHNLHRTGKDETTGVIAGSEYGADEQPSVAPHRSPPPQSPQPVFQSAVADVESKKKPYKEKQDKDTEKVADDVAEKDNWFRRLQRNRYLYFLKNSRWRSKVMRWLFRILRAIFRSIAFDQFRVSLRAGNENPMVVGTLFGWYQVALFSVPLKKPYVLEFEPVFMENCIEGKFQFRVCTSLFRVIIPVGITLGTFPVIHTLWLWWSFHRSKKRFTSPAAS